MSNWAKYFFVLASIELLVILQLVNTLYGLRDQRDEILGELDTAKAVINFKEDTIVHLHRMMYCQNRKNNCQDE